jgi:hypothetical protein
MGGAPPAGVAGDAVWHLVIDREQVGPLTPDEVRAKFSAGEVDAETYVWREGFADWLRLGSIEDFRDLGGAPAAHDEGATRRTDSADLFSQAAAGGDEGDGAGSDLFGGGGAPAPAAQPMAASSDFGGGGGGLFGGAAESAPAKPARQSRPSSPSFGGNGGAPATAALDDASRPMTGQRNENSVLFSLNNLQALASGGGAAAPAPKPGVETRPGFANSQTEGSGLIDIRAMAASTLAAGGSSGPGAGPVSSKQEDPAFAAAPIFSPMAAPILMPAAPSGPPKWLWPVLGVGVLAVVGIIVVGVLLLTRKPEAPPVVAMPTPPAPVPQPGVTPPPVAAQAGTPKEEGKETAPAPKPESGEKKEKPSRGDKPARHEKTTAPKSEGGLVAPPSEAPAPKAAPKKKGDALDDLLNTPATPDKPEPKAAAKPAPKESASDDSLPDQLDKGAIQGGMSKVKGKVASCYEQFKVPGMANVSVTIGKNGHVSNASVTGSFAGTPTGGCVEKAVKGAGFPPFKGSPMTFTYPFILR